MKKFLLSVLGALCFLILLTHIGPMIVLLISLALLYFAFKKFVRSPSAGYKILWAVIGIIALCFSLGNIPSLIGIIGLAGLYFVWRTWPRNRYKSARDADPFDNFEKEWKQL